MYICRYCSERFNTQFNYYQAFCSKRCEEQFKNAETVAETHLRSAVLKMQRRAGKQALRKQQEPEIRHTGLFFGGSGFPKSVRLIR